MTAGLVDPSHLTDTSRGGLAELADFCADRRRGAHPAAVVEKARACLLYGLSVGIGSAHAELPWKVARAVDRLGAGGGPARRLLDGRALAPDAAAFANGSLLHARIQEDAHPAGHVGVVVLPAAIAAAESATATGADLLAAIVVGYEVALRIGRDHAADLSRRGFRTTSTYGAFGAAAAAARLWRLTAAQTADALGLAANTAAGLREFAIAGTEEYAVHAGSAARAGVAAAACALEGITAAPSTLAGEAGFFRAFAAPEIDYGYRLADRLGESFELMAIAFKPWPVCQFHRGIVRGLLVLRERANGSAPERVRIRMNPYEAEFFGVRSRGPFRAFSQTIMSAPFCAALAWHDGAVTFDGMHRFDDAEVLALVPRIEVDSDEACARYQPALEVFLADGRILEWAESDPVHAYDLTWPAAVEMTHALCEEVGVAREAAERLVDEVGGLADASSIRALVDAACAAAGVAARRRPVSRR